MQEQVGDSELKDMDDLVIKTHRIVGYGEISPDELTDLGLLAAAKVLLSRLLPGAKALDVAAFPKGPRLKRERSHSSSWRDSRGRSWSSEGRAPPRVRARGSRADEVGEETKSVDERAGRARGRSRDSAVYGAVARSDDGRGREPDHERDRHRDDGDGDRKRLVHRDRDGAKAPRKHHDDERAAAAATAVDAIGRAMAAIAPVVAAPRDRDDRRDGQHRGYGDHRSYGMTKRTRSEEREREKRECEKREREREREKRELEEREREEREREERERDKRDKREKRERERERGRGRDRSRSRSSERRRDSTVSVEGADRRSSTSARGSRQRDSLDSEDVSRYNGRHRYHGRGKSRSRSAPRYRGRSPNRRW